MSIRERLRDVSISSVLLHGIAGPRGGYPPYAPPPPPPPPPPETHEYVDARTEARRLCANLGLDVGNEHWDGAEVGDFVRLAFAGGWKACESRIDSPDMADAIALAVEHPGEIVDRLNCHQSMVGHIVKAVQRVVVYGAPKDRKAAVAAVMTAGVPKAADFGVDLSGGAA